MTGFGLLLFNNLNSDYGKDPQFGAYKNLQEPMIISSGREVPFPHFIWDFLVSFGKEKGFLDRELQKMAAYQLRTSVGSQRRKRSNKVQQTLKTMWLINFIHACFSKLPKVVQAPRSVQFLVTKGHGREKGKEPPNMEVNRFC